MTSIDSNKKLKQFFNLEFRKIRESKANTRASSKYFGEIGSTEIEDIPYDLQIQIKADSLQHIFSKITGDLIEIEKSPALEKYRFRMDFVCDFNPFHEPNNRFGQRKKGKYNWVIDMDECVLIPKNWFNKSREVYKFINNLGLRNYDLVKKDGELRYMVIRQFEGEAMLNIVTKSNRNDSLIEKTAQFALKQGFKSVYWMLEETERDDSNGKIHKYWGEENILVSLGKKEFKIGPLNFFQNNISAFEKIIEDVKNFINENRTDILYDLYSGIGTLGIIFSEYYKQVYGYEFEQQNVDQFEQNTKLNKIKNYKMQQADLNKLMTDHILEDQTIVIDPPRTGLQKTGIENVLKFNPKYIIYISCNPITQADDLLSLIANYKVKFIKAYDCFPLTYHLESLVIMERN